MKTYALLDSGDLQKWERFGSFILQRPCPQAVWRPQGNIEADAIFSREGENKWTFRRKLPSSWTIELDGVEMKIARQRKCIKGNFESVRSKKPKRSQA